MQVKEAVVIVEEIVIDPVVRLGEDYELDLKLLRSLSPAIVTDTDVAKLTILAIKYGYEAKITRKNFVEVLGSLSKIILDRLETLAIEHYLERVREVTPSKKTKSEKREKEKVPEVLEESE